MSRDWIEHAEDIAVERHVRGRRPTLAKTMCGRWVDTFRIAGQADSVNCTTCQRRTAESTAHGRPAK